MRSLYYSTIENSQTLLCYIEDYNIHGILVSDCNDLASLDGHFMCRRPEVTRALPWSQHNVTPRPVLARTL